MRRSSLRARWRCSQVSPNTDTEIGRLVGAIGNMGQLDNTLIFYIVGDNGASAEGGMNGLFNEMTYFNGVQEQSRTS